MNHDRQPLNVANAFDQVDQVGILHFRADALKAQQTAVDGQGGVQRIEAGRDFHRLRAIDGLAIGEDDTTALPSRSAVGEPVFYDQIFRLFGIGKGGRQFAAVHFRILRILVRARFNIALPPHPQPV